METPDPTVVLPSTLAGRLTDAFAEQFRNRGATAPLLLVQLERMHGGCVADTVRDLAAVRGIAELRWINRPGTHPAMFGDAARAVLAAYLVRIVAGSGAPAPYVCLYHPDATTALVSVRATAGEAYDQRTLTLVDLVDQAVRHAGEWAAEQAGDDGVEAVFAPDPEPALRCSNCERLIGAGEDPQALDLCAGAVCGAAQLHHPDPCPGRLEPVTVVVVPRALGTPR